MAIFNVECFSEEGLIIDSGSTCHVCPPSFASDYPLSPLTGDLEGLKLTASDGSEIPIHGTRDVVFQLEQDLRQVRITFVISDVMAPML